MHFSKDPHQSSSVDGGFWHWHSWKRTADTPQKWRFCRRVSFSLGEVSLSGKVCLSGELCRSDVVDGNIYCARGIVFCSVFHCQEDEQKRSRHVSWWLFLPDVSEKVQEWQNFKAIETSGGAFFCALTNNMFRKLYQMVCTSQALSLWVFDDF